MPTSAMPTYPRPQQHSFLADVQVGL